MKISDVCIYIDRFLDPKDENSQDKGYHLGAYIHWWAKSIYNDSWTLNDRHKPLEEFYIVAKEVLDEQG